MTFDQWKWTNSAKCFLRLPGCHITGGVLRKLPTDWLASLTGERELLPGLNCDMFLLRMDHWRTELHVSHVATSLRHPEQEVEEFEPGGGWSGHDWYFLETSGCHWAVTLNGSSLTFQISNTAGCAEQKHPRDVKLMGGVNGVVGRQGRQYPQSNSYLCF